MIGLMFPVSMARASDVMWIMTSPQAKCIWVLPKAALKAGIFLPSSNTPCLLAVSTGRTRPSQFGHMTGPARGVGLCCRALNTVRFHSETSLPGCQFDFTGLETSRSEHHWPCLASRTCNDPSFLRTNTNVASDCIARHAGPWWVRKPEQSLEETA